MRGGMGKKYPLLRVAGRAQFGWRVGRRVEYNINVMKESIGVAGRDDEN